MAGSPDIIIDGFTELARTRQPVKLINVFKGVPLIFEAMVLEVDEGQVRIKTCPQQIVGLNQDKQTYVQSDRLPSIVHAGVAQVDLVNDQATLSDFELAAPGVGDRQGIRVLPDHPMEVLVEENGREVTVSGKLVDISQGGLSFTVSSESSGRRLFDEGSGLILHLTLPVSDNNREARPLRLEGNVIYVLDSSGGACPRIGVKLYPDEQTKTILAEFVSRRQAEIMDEVNALLEMLPKSTPS